jgi:glycerophosphoryl diester phosphodiesterase
MSLDQQPFLMHDWTMRRTTGFPLPLELTPSFLAHRQTLQHTDEHVHSLSDALDVLPAHLLLAVDLKTPWAIVPLMSAIRRRKLEERVLVWCQSALAVRYASRVAPKVEVAYLKSATDPRGKRDFIWRARRLGAKAVSAHWLAVEREFVAMAHDYGLRVYSYHEAYDLVPTKLQAGLDGLITDYPKAAREAFDRMGEPASTP